MPHSLFLGSALATQDRLSKTPLKGGNPSSSSLEPVSEERRLTGILNRIKSSLNEAFRVKAVDGHKNRPQRHEDRENNSYLFVKSHVYHGVVDIILSLLGVAVVINSMRVTTMTFKPTQLLMVFSLGSSSWQALFFTMDRGGPTQTPRIPQACLMPMTY